MNRVLIVVDMQKDFVNGSLGSDQALQIVENVADKIRSFEGSIIVTMDTHDYDYMQTQEGEKLPVEHCVRDTEGWQLDQVIKEALAEREYKVVHKPSFAAVDLVALIAEYDTADLEIELVGLCTDICVVSNALLLKAHFPEIPIFVDSACCAGVTHEKHQAALMTMESCQITVR